MGGEAYTKGKPLIYMGYVLKSEILGHYSGLHIVTCVWDLVKGNLCIMQRQKR